MNLGVFAMDKIELIVEAGNNEEQEKKIAKLARVKHRLPAVGLYVVEIPKNYAWALWGIEGVKSVCANVCVTAQVR